MPHRRDEKVTVADCLSRSHDYEGHACSKSVTLEPHFNGGKRPLGLRLLFHREPLAGRYLGGRQALRSPGQDKGRERSNLLEIPYRRRCDLCVSEIEVGKQSKSRQLLETFVADGRSCKMQFLQRDAIAEMPEACICHTRAVEGQHPQANQMRQARTFHSRCSAQVKPLQRRQVRQASESRIGYGRGAEVQLTKGDESGQESHSLVGYTTSPQVQDLKPLDIAEGFQLAVANSSTLKCRNRP